MHFRERHFQKISTRNLRARQKPESLKITIHLPKNFEHLHKTLDSPAPGSAAYADYMRSGTKNCEIMQNAAKAALSSRKDLRR